MSLSTPVKALTSQVPTTEDLYNFIVELPTYLKSIQNLQNRYNEKKERFLDELEQRREDGDDRARGNLYIPDLSEDDLEPEFHINILWTPNKVS